MDYDGNDFQSQNFQLSGEDNSRFSSGLRSFSLPKFELDEHYQVHLRFDNLVGPESLLGIQEQEESSWIEDFSSGNTALEFTPGATESCSIPRRKNVWSEATSSESVEILLRSVGEDDVIDGRITILDLDTHNGPHIVNNHMDLSCVQDVTLQSNEVKDMDVDSVPPTDKREDDLPRINKDVTADLPDVEDVSKTFKDEQLGNRVFEELDEGRKGGKANICVLPEHCGSKEIITLTVVESCVTKEKSPDISSNEMTLHDGHLDDEFVDKNASNVHVTSAAVVAEGSKDVTMDQIDPSTSSVSVSANDFEKLPIQNFAKHLTENYCEDVLHSMSQNLVTDDGQNMEFQITKKESGHEHDLSKESRHEHELSEGYRIDHRIDVPESSSSFELKAESSSLLVEGCNEHVVPEKSDGLLEDVAHQIEILSKGNGMSGLVVSTGHETHAFVAEAEINPDEQSVKISSSGSAKQSTLMKIDSSEQVTGGPYGASVEPKVSFEKHDLHVENALLEKDTVLIEDSDGKELGKSVIVAEENADGESHLPECSKNVDSFGSFVEPKSLKTTSYEAQGTEEKAEDNLMINLPESTSHGPGSAVVQKSVEDETLENDTRIMGDTLNARSQVEGEAEKPPNSNDEGSVDTHILHLLDARPLEKCNTVCEVEDRNSDIHTTLLTEKACTRSSTISDNLNFQTAEKPQDASALNQNTHIQAGDVEGQLAEGTIQAVTGDAVNCKGNSLQPVSSSGFSSEPHLLEGGDGDPSSFQPGSDSPTVICCSQPSGEVEQQELNRQLSDHTHPMSGDLTQAPCSGKNSEEIKSAATDPKESNASEDRSFTFEVRSVPDISESASVGGWKPFSVVQSRELPQAEERCSTVSALKQTNAKSVNETPSSDNKSTHRDKNRSVSGSSAERSTTSKRKSVKETLALKEAAEKSGTPCTPPLAKLGTVSREMQLDEKYQYSHSEGAGVKLSSASTLQTSNFSDLNTGAALFHQPFTDVQQVQLRAQIFVYGSLIQGTPPEETCMISAFGNTDGARNTWDGIWRTSLERFNCQKSPTANLETPLHSHSGVRVHDSVSRSSLLPSKTHTTPVSRINSMGASTVLPNFTSLSSPLWNFSPNDPQSNLPRGLNLDPNQILSPLHGHQSSRGKHYSGIGNPWLSQASPVPWVASSQPSTIDTKAHLSASSIAETVQLTPIRGTSVLNSSNQQFLTPTAGGPLAVSATTTIHMEPANKISSQAETKTTGNQKTRKRRKSTVSDAPVQVLPAPQPCKELDSGTLVTKHQPASIVSLPVISSPLSPTHFQIIGSYGNEQKVIFSEETCSKIEQARFQAEDAAAFAAVAIRHMEGIWSQLSAQKNSGLGSETEMKLVSAAVAAAAASSVAKAAAAAAKVASDAAMQVKMMADEALSNRTGNSVSCSQTVHSGQGTNLSRGTPVSAFKGKDKTGSGSVISAAKEAARRRVEAASAASKRAENLDAIVKAAELAAVAVSQAGAVISMGDPLPFKLSDLIEAGPDNYWKAQRPLAEDATNSETQRDKQMALICADGHNEPLQGLNSASWNKKHIQRMIDEGDTSSRNELRQSMENQTGVSEPASFDVLAPDYNKNSTVVNQKEKSIQEGSLVDVLFDEDSARRVWYSAKVLSLKDGKAYVCVNDYSKAGSGKLKEWISLEGEADKPPRIRIAHPTTSIKYEGTRKRRRAALGSYVWAVGDRVDAWTNDGWCEGVVTDKSKEDETKLSVCFSAGGDTSIVRAWHLRPSLIWKDSQWVEWSRLRENTSHLQEGDTPQEKRQKLGRLVTENDHNVKNLNLGKQSADHQIEYSRKTEESQPLLLSENDKIFSVGKNVREENNPDTLRIKRTGQKEGSRVVFGVPRPGKKRKFMEVSKHYVTGKINNVCEGSDAVKHAKYLPPQASSGWKNNTKMDPKGRKGGEPKPKVTRPVKPQSTQMKGATQRNGSFPSMVSSSNGVGMGRYPLPTAKPSASNEEKSEKIIIEAVPLTNNWGIEQSTLSESSIRPVPGIPPSRKKTFIAIESDVGAKGKVASALEKTKTEEKHSNLTDHLGKTIGDATELRRSSRRIQPTSRLLEGLQSSMIISKIPSVSHEKGPRASQRNVPSSKGSIHG